MVMASAAPPIVPSVIRHPTSVAAASASASTAITTSASTTASASAAAAAAAAVVLPPLAMPLLRAAVGAACRGSTMRIGAWRALP